MDVYYNDFEPYPCQVLRDRIAEGLLPQGFVDERSIKEVQASDLKRSKQIHLFAGIGGFPLGFKWAGMPSDFSIITGGFPCQDISTAGKGAGLAGERSGLWFEMLRVIRLVRPQFIVIENVAALLGRGLSTVLRDIAESGYDAEWQVISAADIGAPHLRKRVWIVANAKEQPIRTGLCEGESRGSGRRRSSNSSCPADWWFSEPDVGRVAHGIPKRMDRLKGLGNAIVPQIAQLIGERILQFGAST